MCHPDEGWLHKAVDIKGQLHIIEELQLFEEPQPVNNLLISDKQVVTDAQTATFIRSNFCFKQSHLCPMCPIQYMTLVSPSVECVRGLSIRRGSAATL